MCPFCDVYIFSDSYETTKAKALLNYQISTKEG